MSASAKVTGKNVQFTTENISKLVLRFSIPVIISLLVAEMYNMVDSLFVGRVVGAKGIAALTIAFPVQRLFQAISLLVAIGASTAVARSSGENNYSKIKKIVPNAFIILISMILFLILGMFIFKDSIIMKLGCSEAIFPYANTYISIILIGVLFQGLTFLISYILTSFGDTKIILLSTSIGAMFNIVLDYIAVVILNYGVGGAAFATVVSQIIAFIYALIKFIHIKNKMNLKLTGKLDKSISKAIVFVGFSTFVIEISDAVVAVILNKILVQMGGDAAIIAVGLISRISMFLFINIIGISSAMQPIAAYNYGAEMYNRVKEIVKFSVKLVTISSVILWGLTMIFTKQLISVFVNDMDIINYTTGAFRVVVALLPCIGIYYVTIYYYQARGMAKTSFLLSIFRQIVVFIPLLYIMVYGFGLGIMGAWIAYPISDVISLIISIIYIKNDELEDMEQELVKEKRGIVTA